MADRWERWVIGCRIGGEGGRVGEWMADRWERWVIGCRIGGKGGRVREVAVIRTFLFSLL